MDFSKWDKCFNLQCNIKRRLRKCVASKEMRIKME